MLKRPLLVALALLTSACVVGAPPGFSDGDLWEVPLIAPLEDDLLLVPVSINDEGPFLFMIDPDSPKSSIESSIQSSLDLYAGRLAGQVQTTEDHMVRIIEAEVKKMTIGDLKIRNMRVRVHPDATFWSGGRRVRGILGRDAISDSLIYSFDRDRGMMYIGTQGHLKAPEGAEKLSFTQSYSQHRRYLAKVKLNRKHGMTMHLDLGARTSMLWPALAKKYKLPTIPLEAELVDELGTKQKVRSGSMAGIIDAGASTSNALLMLPYADKRLEPEDLDGLLGQNFWSRFNVTVNWHRKKFYLQPRNRDLSATAAERLARWGDQLSSCAKPACVSASIPELVQAPAPAPAESAPTESAPTESAPTETAPTEAAPTEAAPTAGGAASFGPEAPGAVEPATTPTEMAPAASAPQSLSLLIERDAPGNGFAYDVVIAAVDDQGKTIDLPVFLVSFGPGISSLRWNNLDADYARAAGFKVVDMNPVGTRGCQGSRCIYPMRALR